MTYYSSDEFFRDWRYAIDKDFTTSEGDAFQYAKNGKQAWGDELKKLTFPTADDAPWREPEPHGVCVSSDGKRLAVAVKSDVHVIDTETWEVILVLTGHENRIDAISFKPGDSNILVSSDQPDPLDGGRALPLILIWDIDKAQKTVAPNNEKLSPVVKAATDAVSKGLLNMGIKATDTELAKLNRAFNPAVERLAKSSTLATPIQRIAGRLNTSYSSNVFSLSGKWMAYFPGRQPRYNENDPWDVTICSTTDFEDRHTLRGHTDLVTWVGWSPDESLFASVCWDGTIRIWDMDTGKTVSLFVTGYQNWTGAFSPDSKYFAATPEAGKLYVWALADSALYWEFKEGGSNYHWKRAIDWHPNGKWLAVGSENLLQLLDIESKQMIQERTFSPAMSVPDSEAKREMMVGFIEALQVKFFEHGNKIAFWLQADGSAEVIDIKQEVKWRFARGGTDDGPNADKWRDDKGKVTSISGSGMAAWEDQDDGQVYVASVDYDGIRIWSTK
ncbi:WD40 repeat-like-containing domain [Paramyrothecium foliicola]|nr:WD40 repeat-like-containing domain [Paramyrothecium foliicola]